MPADTGRVAVYQYRTGKMPMCKTVDHCYEGGSKTVVDRYHSGNNLGTGPVLFQYYNVYWDTTARFCYSCSITYRKNTPRNSTISTETPVKCYNKCEDFCLEARTMNDNVFHGPS